MKWHFTLLRQTFCTSYTCPLTTSPMNVIAELLQCSTISLPSIWSNTIFINGRVPGLANRSNFSAKFLLQSSLSSDTPNNWNWINDSQKSLKKNIWWDSGAEIGKICELNCCVIWSSTCPLLVTPWCIHFPTKEHFFFFFNSGSHAGSVFPSDEQEKMKKWVVKKTRTKLLKCLWRKTPSTQLQQLKGSLDERQCGLLCSKGVSLLSKRFIESGQVRQAIAEQFSWSWQNLFGW